MTTRRGPGVPGVEHGTVPALPEDAGGQAVDLAAIRRPARSWICFASRRLRALAGAGPLTAPAHALD
ncbi:MAG TPA: hypothetical protein VH641_06990 [Streptosporangiaceae bacterium]